MQPEKKAKRQRQPKKRFVRLYTDYVKGHYWKVQYSDGVDKILVDILMSTMTLTKNKRGFPFECVIAHGIEDYAKAHPECFPHPVLFAYVTKTAVYIVDRFKNGQPFHAWRYAHTFARMVNAFDRMTKEKFVERYNGTGFTLALSPGRKSRAGESHVGGNGEGGSRSHKISRGAMERAQAAGLIPTSHSDEEQVAA